MDKGRVPQVITEMNEHLAYLLAEATQKILQAVEVHLPAVAPALVMVAGVVLAADKNPAVFLN